jgi:hypothetical protein
VGRQVITAESFDDLFENARSSSAGARPRPPARGHGDDDHDPAGGAGEAECTHRSGFSTTPPALSAAAPRALPPRPRRP